MTTTTSIDQPARDAINAGHALTTALREALSPVDREKLDLFASAGAAVALTITWRDGAVELRVGVLPEDSPPMTILALNFAQPGGGAAAPGEGQLTH